MILLETVHGSRLYGLATPESDFDSFKVIADNPTRRGKYARQATDGTYDQIVCDLSTFVQYASKGVPQYLEAMWSPIATVDEIPEMRWSFRPDFYTTVYTYEKLINREWNEPGLKAKTRAYRWLINLLDFNEYGIFNPILSDDQKETLEDMVREDIDPKEYLNEVISAEAP